VDALSMQFRTLKLRRDPQCPACGTREIRALIDYEQFCGITPAGAGAEADTAGRNGHEEEEDEEELTPAELSARIARGDPLQLIDVREPYEWEIGKIPSARLIPLGTLQRQLDSLDRGRQVVVYCRSGVRSAHAAAQLRHAGFPRVLNLTGGILRWSDEVDPSIPKY
jgi:adenylyltransferase/sulfurtransferase